MKIYGNAGWADGLDLAVFPADERISVVEAYPLGDCVSQRLERVLEIVAVHLASNVGDKNDAEAIDRSSAAAASTFRRCRWLQCSRRFAVDLGVHGIQSRTEDGGVEAPDGGADVSASEVFKGFAFWHFPV
jgi:hypothetical protein